MSIEDAQLHARIAAGIRALILHKLPGTNAENGVRSVLATVAVALHRGEAQSDQKLVATIRNAVSNFVAQQMPHAGSTGPSRPAAGERAANIHS